MQAATPTTAPIRFVRNGFVPAAGAAQAKCSTCPRRELCLTAGMGEEEIARIDGLLFARRRIQAGEAVFRAGEGFQFLYAVRSGTFKTVVTHGDGREQVTGFHMAGDTLGLDALAEGRYTNEAVALEDAEVCAVPYAQLAQLMFAQPAMRQVLTRLMGRAIVQEHSPMLLLGSMNAEERVATFLLDISERMQARGYSAREFHLRMSRAEIGSYLGLKLETVSRTLSAFQQEGLLEVDKKHIRILDLDALDRGYAMRVH